MTHRGPFQPPPFCDSVSLFRHGNSPFLRAVQNGTQFSPLPRQGHSSHHSAQLPKARRLKHLNMSRSRV